jgi:acyl-CoA synthetase (AMP-forming)/AMP-acid ligase II
VLRFRSDSHGDRRAFLYLPDGESEGPSLTYGELDHRAQRIAAGLLSRCKKGDRALLLFSDALEFITSFFGCLYAGVIAVPLPVPNWKRPSSRISCCVKDSQPKILLTSTNLLEKLKQHPLPALSDLPAQNTETLSSTVEKWKPPELYENDLAYLQYTSGSTTTPKGVMVSHGNLLHNSSLIELMENNNSESINGSWLPFFHDMGLLEGILQPVYAGFHSVLMPPVAFLKRPIRWFQMISRFRVTSSGGPNSAFDLCLRQINHHQMEGIDLSCWRVCYNGSEPVQKQTIQRFYAAFNKYGLQWNAIRPVYGLAEATLAVSASTVSPPVFFSVNSSAFEQHKILSSQDGSGEEKTLVASGSIHPNFFETAIVDPESGAFCEADRIGEVWLKGNSVTQGYWNRPEQTLETFQARTKTGEGPYLKTGDLGFIKNGELFITGRCKDLIIIAGRNHYPQDIERTAQCAHPALLQNSGAAFSLEDEGEERLVLINEIAREFIHTINFEEIFGAVRQAVSEEHGIRLWKMNLVRPGTIPKTTSGKIQRANCKLALTTGQLAILHPQPLIF